MSFNLNDNQCECGHPRSVHVHDGKFEPRWCGLNQKSCGCWEYVARKLENKEIFDLQIVIEK